MESKSETNREIAIFMGYAPYDNGDERFNPEFWLTKTDEGIVYCQVKDLEYHTSWDWIIPVCIEIKSRTYDNFWLETSKSWPLLSVINGDILQTHEAAYKFIHWYKQQEK